MNKDKFGKVIYWILIIALLFGAMTILNITPAELDQKTQSTWENIQKFWVNGANEAQKEYRQNREKYIGTPIAP